MDKQYMIPKSILIFPLSFEEHLRIKTAKVINIHGYYYQKHNFMMIQNFYVKLLRKKIENASLHIASAFTSAISV